MPVMDGYTAVRTIRAWETEHRRPATPILALTASTLDAGHPARFRGGLQCAHRQARAQGNVARGDRRDASARRGRQSQARDASPPPRRRRPRKRGSTASRTEPQAPPGLRRPSSRRSPRGAGLSAERQLPTFSSGARRRGRAPQSGARPRRRSVRTRDHPDESAAGAPRQRLLRRGRGRASRERGLARHGRGVARRRRRRRGQGRLRARDVRAYRAALRPRQPVDDDGTRPPMAPPRRPRLRGRPAPWRSTSQPAPAISRSNWRARERAASSARISAPAC